MKLPDRPDIPRKTQQNATSRKEGMKKLIALNSQGRVVGENHPRAKLLNSEVDQVLELIEEGFSYSQVAAKMQLSKSGVAHIATGRRRCQTPERYVEVSVPD